MPMCLSGFLLEQAQFSVFTKVSISVCVFLKVRAKKKEGTWDCRAQEYLFSWHYFPGIQDYL